MKWRWLGVLAALLPGVSDAQLDIVNGLTVEEYVNDILLGSGVQASNIVLSGSIEQLGYLTGGDGTFSVTSGLVMSTEVATNSDCQVEDFCINCVAPSPDPELLAIANSVPPLIGQTFTVNSLHDLVALEFDFTAMGDTVRFNYVFGSDEYLTFVNTQYNDAFGFFLSGPGITGPFSSPPGFPGGSVNIAFVPGSDPELPITISSVNNVTNSAYYINNPGGASGACLNGYTVPFTAEWPVECGETYHIRLVIADGSDTALESIVVLAEGSVHAIAVVDVDLVIDVGGVEGNVLHEGCGSATLTFTRPQETIIEVQEYVVISYDGSVGINGIDFSLLPDTVFFPPGVYTQEFNLQAFQDGLNEGAELVVMEILNVAACNGAGLTTFFEFNLADNPPPLVVEPAELLLCPGGSVTVEPVVSGGYGFYTYSWCDGSTGETLSVTPSASYTCELVVGDTCALPTAAADFDITILLPPAATAGPDLIACGDATLGGTILGLPPATCSDDAGNYTYCYGENEVTSFTYCPDTPGDGTYMTVSFSGGFNENFFDEMYVYDGPDATAPLLAGPVYGALAGQTYIANNPGGCLTLQIQTDGSVSCVSGALEPWEYAVGCTNAGGVTWSWSPAAGLGSTTVPNPIVNVTESTTYTLTAGLAIFPFCSTTDQVTVSPSFNFTHALTEPGCFMNDGAVTVEVVPNGTSGPWMVRAVLNGVVVASALNTGGSTTLGGLAPGTYVLEVEDDICLADEAFTLAVPPMLTITASADTTICIDGTAILTASAAFADPNLQWHWSTGSTNSSITVGPGSDETYGGVCDVGRRVRHRYRGHCGRRARALEPRAHDRGRDLPGGKPRNRREHRDRGVAAVQLRVDRSAVRGLPAGGSGPNRLPRPHRHLLHHPDRCLRNAGRERLHRGPRSGGFDGGVCPRHGAGLHPVRDRVDRARGGPRAHRDGPVDVRRWRRFLFGRHGEPHLRVAGSLGPRAHPRLGRRVHLHLRYARGSHHADSAGRCLCCIAVGNGLAGDAV